MSDHVHRWEFGDSWAYPYPESVEPGLYEVLVCECGAHVWQEHTHE